MAQGRANILKIISVLITPCLAFGLISCSSLSTELPLEDQIREYLYKYQPTTGPQFVAWANKNLSGYSAQQVYTALHKEGAFQAKLGHPNVVGVLSFAAQSWAEQNNLAYDAQTWIAWQQVAISKLRPTPEKIQLWPDD